tara:strand:- start:212 stop:532 length:321 start_codon:yes stop_codon:yes gene_type:complete
MKIVLALFAGILVGIAQILTSNILIRNNISFLIITLILLIYFLSGIIWITLLKFGGNLALFYAILISGSLFSIIIGNQLLLHNNIVISTKELLAVFLIAIGCYLLK